MLSLPDVTLVAIDTVCHDLTRLALEDSLRGIEFGDCLVFTDKKEAVPDSIKWLPTYIENNYEAEHFLWHSVPFHIKTSHYLCVQWDGFVINPQVWDDEWLQYDYIGAPWNFFDEYNVGNGGFSLRSVKMSKHIARHVDRFRFRTPEDGSICRLYGSTLRGLGFKFPEELVASRFSIETVWPNPDIPHFGFHGLGNFPRVFNEEQLSQRMALIPEYVRNKFNLDKFVHQTVLDLKDEGKELGYLIG